MTLFFFSALNLFSFSFSVLSLCLCGKTLYSDLFGVEQGLRRQHPSQRQTLQRLARRVVDAEDLCQTGNLEDVFDARVQRMKNDAPIYCCHHFEYVQQNANAGTGQVIHLREIEDELPFTVGDETEQLAFKAAWDAGVELSLQDDFAQGAALLIGISHNDQAGFPTKSHKGSRGFTKDAKLLRVSSWEAIYRLKMRWPMPVMMTPGVVMMIFRPLPSLSTTKSADVPVLNCAVAVQSGFN